MRDRDLYSGFIRLHILYHASKGPVYGLWIMEELAKHGYKMSAGTLYPLLHKMETQEYLLSKVDRAGRSARRVYILTEKGRRALADAKLKVKELFGELFEDEKQTNRRGR